MIASNAIVGRDMLRPSYDLGALAPGVGRGCKPDVTDSTNTDTATAAANASGKMASNVTVFTDPPATIPAQMAIPAALAVPTMTTAASRQPVTTAWRERRRLSTATQQMATTIATVAHKIATKPLQSPAVGNPLETRRRPRRQG